MEKARSDTGPVVQTKLNLGKLDKTQFYDAAISAGLGAGLYPISSVAKTRMQVATKGMVDKSAYSGLRGLLRTEGIPGVYRGFGTAMTGTVLVNIVFFTAFETTKVAAYKRVEPLKLPDPTKAQLANGIAGIAGFVCFMGAAVPIDVMSQRLMVQGYSGHASYNGALDVARKVLKQDGIRGLYRGFGLSVMHRCLSGAALLTSYSYSKQVIWSLLGHGTDGNRSNPSNRAQLLVTAAGGIFANAAQLCIMAPLDTIKTRLQVMGHKKRPSTRQVIKTLIADEGWKGFYRGFGPMCFAACVLGTSDVLVGSYFKIRALKRDKASREMISHGNGRSQ